MLYRLNLYVQNLFTNIIWCFSFWQPLFEASHHPSVPIPSHFWTALPSPSFCFWSLRCPASSLCQKARSSSRQSSIYCHLSPTKAGLGLGFSKRFRHQVSNDSTKSLSPLKVSLFLCPCCLSSLTVFLRCRCLNHRFTRIYFLPSPRGFKLGKLPIVRALTCQS